MTLKFLDFNNFPKDADIIPFPSDDVTPPVTNIYFDELDTKQYCLADIFNI